MPDLSTYFFRAEASDTKSVERSEGTEQKWADPGALFIQISNGTHILNEY